MDTPSNEEEEIGAATAQTVIDVTQHETPFQDMPLTEEQEWAEKHFPKPKPRTSFKQIKKAKAEKIKKAKQRAKARVRCKRHGVVGRKWSWGHVNIFQPMTKWTKVGRLIRPTTRETIPGCIYYAMKRIKRGSDRSVWQAAMADGLATLTTRTDTFTRVQVELRLLSKLGVITRTKHTKTRTL